MSPVTFGSCPCGAAGPLISGLCYDCWKRAAGPGEVCTCGNPGRSEFIDTVPGPHHTPPCPLARGAGEAT